MTDANKPPVASLLVIGNEILSGKVTDQNIAYLASELFEMGWEFREVAIVGDVYEDIIDSLKRLKERSEHIFTSGGVGPTHDDITLQAVASATERELVPSPMLEKILKKHYRTEVLSPAQQRLASIPAGCTLHYGPGSLYPQIVVDGIYPLPGIPDLFRKKFQELKSLWPEVEAPGRHCFKLVAAETDLAAVLGALAEEHPEVSLGSYPTEVDGTWELELVLESRSSGALESAVGGLKKVLRGRELSFTETSGVD